MTVEIQRGAVDESGIFLRSGIKGELSRWMSAGKTGLEPRTLLTQLMAREGAAVWYQPGIGVTGTLNASDWANWTGPGSVGASGDLAQASGANQPIYLPHVGANYAYLPAAASNTLTSPNQSVTGSKTITFDVALNDYTPAADVTLFDKTSGNDGFAVKWLTTDKIRLVVGDGVGLTNVDVVAASSFADGSRHTATIAWADGVGATFSYDGVQSGSQVAAVKTLTNAAVALTIGSATSIGKVYRLQVGSLYDMNAALAGETTTNGATFTGGAAETWTLNNTGGASAQIVGSPSLLCDGTGHYMQATFTFNQPAYIIAVMRQVTWTLNDFLFAGVTAGNMLMIKQDTTPDVKIYAGTASAANAGLALGSYGILTAGFNGASGYFQINNNTALTGDYGANNLGGLTLSAREDAALFGNNQFKEIIALTAAPSAEKLLRIKQLLAAIHGITL